MAGAVTRGDISNSILKRLSEADFALLQPHLETIDLPRRKRLEFRNRKITNVDFIERGIASVVASGSARPSMPRFRRHWSRAPETRSTWVLTCDICLITSHSSNAMPRRFCDGADAAADGPEDGRALRFRGP
jgi:hypothetical protein